VERLEGVWRGLTGEDVFPRSLVHGPWRYFQQLPSVHPNSGLRRIVEDGLTYKRLEDAVVPLEVVATSVADGRERWLVDGPAVEAVLASAAIPAIFPPVEIGGELLIDGGVVDNVPIARAIDAGATRVFVFLCGPLSFTPRPARRPVEAVLAALFIAVHARFARELALVPPGIEVVVFSGGAEPTGDYRDFSATPELIDVGRAEAAATLDRLMPAGRLPPVPPGRRAVVSAAGGSRRHHRLVE
jgi:NTE family protein